MRSAWILSLAVAAGCGGHRPPAEVPETRPRPKAGSVMVEPPRPGEMALIDAARWLRAGAGDDAPRARVATDAGTTLLLRVVAAKGALTQVQNLHHGAEEGQCRGQAIAGLEDFELAFFVRTDELLYVVRQDTEKIYADGSGWRVVAGEPLDATLLVADGGLLLEPRWQTGVLGRSYPAPGPLLGDLVRGHQVKPGQDFQTSAGERVRFEPGASVHAERVGEQLRVTGGGSCAQATVIARPDQVIEAPETLSLGSGSGWGEGCSHASEVLPGTPVFWPDGTSAGKVVERHTLCHGIESRPDGMSCFHLRLASEERPDALLPICFQQAHLR